MAVMKMGMYMSGKGARYIVVSIESRRWNTFVLRVRIIEEDVVDGQSAIALVHNASVEINGT